jgi:membrane protease YdiL (CAAX protease family)
VGEELFFRGYLYRAALAFGGTSAFALTAVSFIAMHAPQSWGNWGGLLAISVTGLVLTLMRAASGSVLVPLLAHLLYNFVLSFGSF